MAIDPYKRRTLLRMLEQMKPAQTFFLSTFFDKNEDVSTTEYVDIDIIKGKRKLAPFVNPRNQGVMMEREGYTTNTYKPAYVKPKMVITVDDILHRQPGETIYGSEVNQTQRAAAQLAKDLAYLNDCITRREEWMAAQALQTGKIPVVGYGVDDEVDFLMDSSHKIVLTGTDTWDDHTNATPIQNLKTWARRVRQSSGLPPTDCVMHTSVYDNFLQCEEVVGTSGGAKSLFDTRRIDIGEIQPQQLPGGVTYVGRLRDVNVDLWTYEEWYYDEDAEEERSMMDVDRLILGSRVARTDRKYGAIRDLDVTGAVKRFPKSWTEQDPSARYLMVQSAPLPVLTQVDAFLTAKVK
jgi:hypothetical protein